MNKLVLAAAVGTLGTLLEPGSDALRVENVPAVELQAFLRVADAD